MRIRQYEGPARKINDFPRTEEDVRSRRGMPGGKSYADRLTAEYGEEGVGWEFATDAYTIDNQIEAVDTQIHHKLAREALSNKDQTDVAVTNDGVPLSASQLDEYTRSQRPPKGDILVYPDGDKK